MIENILQTTNNKHKTMHWNPTYKLGKTTYHGVWELFKDSADAMWRFQDPKVFRIELPDGKIKYFAGDGKTLKVLAKDMNGRLVRHSTSFVNTNTHG